MSKMSEIDDDLDGIKIHKLEDLILVRGLPGSGKSTFATKLYNRFDLDEASTIEADSFHMIDGEYRYDSRKNKYAHLWCQSVTAAILNKNKKAIVANTFVTFEEIYPYIKIAKDFGVDISVIDCLSNYGSIHGVSADIIESMRNRWDNFIMGNDIIDGVYIDYSSIGSRFS